jgi:hypothetical protein
MWIKQLVGGVVLLTVASGCASAADAGTLSTDSRAQAVSPSKVPSSWAEPSRYRFVLKAGCTLGFTEVPFAVTVANGRVERVEPLDQRARDAVKTSTYRVPTLGELLARARQASADGQELRTAFEPVDGHPTEVTFNPSGAALDVADCSIISEYAKE